ncbi:hypothetical protein Acr_15g0010060 [Actinidia rufa]|uniref:Uncharacterized protein n=1 Tax=Actinidia rufa TaxID=165716 RepID=A0A7J0FWU7_9ERIC|nr:hypothetical protein Acr_15g0010060 [Actinidia rufa]
MKDTEGDEQEDDWADQTMHWTRGDVPGEDISEQSLIEKACVEASERDYSGGTNEQVSERHKKRSKEGGQRRGLKKEGHRGQEKRRDKKNCPRNKAQDQSSEAATTAIMAVDESDVLLAASADEESDWISDSGIAYHLCRDREVFSTHVTCEGLVRMANDAIVGKGQSRSDEALKLVEEHSEFPRKTGEAARRRKTGRLYRLRENVQTGELLSDIDPVDPQWNRSARRCFGIRAKSLARHEKVQPVQDVHEEAQRRETESMHNDRRDVAETSLFRSRSVAVISPVVHTREERWSHDDLQSDVLCRAPRSYRRAGPEVVGKDNLKTSDYPPMGWRGRLKGGAEKCNPWGITESTQLVAVCRGAGLCLGRICYGALRAQRAERVVSCESETVRW